MIIIIIIIINHHHHLPLLPYSFISAPEVCDSLDQAVHNYILSLQIRGFIFDLTLAWSQFSEVKKLSMCHCEQKVKSCLKEKQVSK